MKCGYEKLMTKFGTWFYQTGPNTIFRPLTFLKKTLTRGVVLSNSVHFFISSKSSPKASAIFIQHTLYGELNKVICRGHWHILQIKVFPEFKPTQAPDAYECLDIIVMPQIGHFLTLKKYYVFTYLFFQLQQGKIYI